MNAKLPAIVVSSVIFFALGIGVGVVSTSGFGYQWTTAAEASDSDKAGTPPSKAKSGVPKSGGETKGGGGKKGGKGGGFFSARSQLAALVNKLDVLTSKPLHLDLSADTKAKVNEQLQGLAEDKELTDETAQRRLDALLEVLKDRKETLEAAGFRWPGGGGTRFTAPPAGNPFADQKAAGQLKALQQRLQG